MSLDQQSSSIKGFSGFLVLSHCNEISVPSLDLDHFIDEQLYLEDAELEGPLLSLQPIAPPVLNPAGRLVVHFVYAQSFSRADQV